MQMASSAKRTCSAWRSASLYTATVRMPISLHAQMMRSAISPRLAIRTLRMEGPQGKQRLPVLHWLTVLNEALHDFARAVALNFIHQLHRFHDADHLPVVDVVANLHKRGRARRRRLIERAHNGRLHNV